MVSITLLFIASASAELLEPGMTIGETHHLGHGHLWWAEVDVASSASGHTLFAWETGVNVKARIFDSQGSPVSDEILVGAYLEEMKIEVAATPDGSFLVAWSGYDPADEMFTHPEFRARFFQVDGTPVSDTLTVALSAHAAVSATSNGDFIATWSIDSENSTDDIFAQRYSSTGEPLDDQVHVANVESDLVGSLDAAPYSTGGFAVLWMRASTEEELWFRRFDVSGSAVAEPELVTSGDLGSFARIIAGGNETFLIKWYQQTETGKEIQAERYTASGAESVDLDLAPATHSAPVYRVEARPGGGYTFIWSATVEGEDARRQFFREFDAAMLPVGGPIEIETLDWWTSWTTHHISGAGVSATGISFAYEDGNQEYIGRTVAGAGIDLAVDAAISDQFVTGG